MFGRRRDDPTADWPAAGPVPVLDFDRQAIGPLRLGDPFADAQALGRPTKLHGSLEKGAFTLEYPAFELEFMRGHLACVKFELEGAASVPMAGDIRLVCATSPLDAQVWFGDPASDSTDGKRLRWIDFERGGATLALEFEGDELRCVQLYSEAYA